MIDGRFMGQPMEFWIELKKRAEELDATRLIEEIATLSAKVNFYETRLDDMSKFRAAAGRLQGRGDDAEN